MKSTAFALTKYEADDGFVFDWKEPRFTNEVDEEGVPTGNEIQEHLYVKTIFIGGTDSIDNYIEVIKPSS